jgi:hypothetical protein
MSDDGQKLRTWLWWIELPVLMLVIYALSVIPAALISNQLVLAGIVSPAESRAIDGIYAPLARIPVLRDALKSAIEIMDSLLP